MSSFWTQGLLWSLPLLKHPLHFNEMKRYIGIVSFKTLSLTLKGLEVDGLIHREEYSQIPPKVEYSLTERGKALIPVLDMMCEWGDEIVECQ